MRSSASLAIVANVVTPYRIHFHRRVAAEIPELGLHSIFLHASSDFRWSVDLPPEIHPVSFARPGDDTRDGFLRHPIRDLVKGRRIVRHLLKNDVRAVVVVGYNHLAFLEVLRQCHRRRIPVFLCGDSNIKADGTSSRLHPLLKRMALRWIFGRCAGFMPMGHYGQAYFEKYGADPERCSWVPYEPDYAFFANADPRAREEFARRHGLTAGRRILLYSGRLVPVKRVDLLLDAFARIAAKRPAWDLAIAGDGPLRSELERRVPEGLGTRVRWLGFCEMEEMRNAYQRADVLVLPSEIEPWAVVVNEAVASGMVVVASDAVGAARELVEDRSSGRIFPTGDLEALVAALLDVTDEETHRRYSERVFDVLAAWRAKADPVRGIRVALERARVAPRELDVDSSGLKS